MMKVNEKALDFALNDAKGNVVRLSDFLGKKVVLYFYPKDNTPGCTKQACAFKANFAYFQQHDIVLIGISKDSARSHTNFATKYELPFILLSDPDNEVANSYGIVKEKKLYGKSFMGVVRSTFIINEEGYVEKIMEKVKPDTNPAEVIAYLEGKNAG
ncbi:MAG: thioredoxin-dependent thiol peroxidase [Erysipelotrichaceae bacterium]|nr:thioredoxin-dependent thiol peroxidase [Erysipelotrichaceae bacterium]MDY5251540.1 thioredoxin-dependent thiol peroxidase [Erysipelotrichaceae bacterium]